MSGSGMDINENSKYFDFLPGKQAGGSCMSWLTNVCEYRNLVEKNGKKDRLCVACKQELSKIMSDPILGNMTLQKFVILSIEDRLEYIIRHKIWKNTHIIGHYKPDPPNKMFKWRSIAWLERKDLTLW